MRRKVIPDHFAVFHDESNALEFGNVGEWIARDGNEIGEFPGLDGTDAVLPAEHFGGIDGDRAKDVERRHSGVMQTVKHCRRGLARRFSGIEQAHV